MSNTVIKIENLYKEYRLGVIGHGTLYRDLQSWWAKVRGKPDPNSLIGVANQHESKDSILALNNINLDVEDGEVLGIIGPNGAGKSTLLKILSKVTTPTSGVIKYNGRIASLLEVGTGFHSELTGRENIYLNGAINGMARKDVSKKLDEIVDFAGVDKYLDTPVKRYSSGMHVRLGFAVAAHLEPDILVVDEVLAVGDAEFQKKAISKMKNISESKGRTVLFVSHNMGSIEKLCSRAVLVENGSITENGPVRQVIATYLKSNLNDRGEKQWNDAAIAPGDEVACLRSIRACNAEGRVLNEFNVTESFYIEVEFSVLKSTHNLNVSLYFSDESGNIIFVTGDFQDKRWQDHVRSRGIHRSRAHIPGNLLNEGTIRILVAIVTNPYTLHALQRDAISIKIRDDYDPDGARGNYTKKWRGGAVRPLLKWSFDFEPLNED